MIILFQKNLVLVKKISAIFIIISTSALLIFYLDYRNNLEFCKSCNTHAGRVIELDENKIFVYSKGKFIIARTFEQTDLVLYEKITFSGEVKKIEEAELPNEYARYLKSREISYVSNNIKIESSRSDVITSIGNFRKKIIYLLNTNLGHNSSSLANGVLLGINSNFNEEFEENLRLSGLSHIVAASGFNITLIYLLVGRLKGFTSKKFLTFVGIVIMILSFLLIGITNLPAMRATIFMTILAISSQLGHRPHIITSLLFSILVCLIIFPSSIFNVSLLLSVSAMIGLLFLSPRLALALSRIFKINKYIIDSSAISFSIILTTSPVLLYFFNSYSLNGILSNLLVTPLVPMLTYLTLLSIPFFKLGIDHLSIFIDIIVEIIFIVTNTVGKFKIGFIDDLTLGFTLWLILLFIYIYIDFYSRKIEKNNQLKSSNAFHWLSFGLAK